MTTLVQIFCILICCLSLSGAEKADPNLWLYQKRGESFGLLRMGHVIRDDAGMMYVITKPVYLEDISNRYGPPDLTGFDSDQPIIAIWNNSNEFVSAAALQVSPDMWIYDIALDDLGRVFLYGLYEEDSWVVINGRKQVVKKRGLCDGILIRCDTNAVISQIWQLGGKGRVYADSIVAMPDGSICATGTFDDEMYLANPQQSIRSRGSYDVYLVNIRPDGTQGWINQMGGPKHEGVEKMTADDKGFLYLTGRMACPGNVPKSYRHLNVFYVAKLDPSGTTLWIRQATGLYDSQGWKVQIDRFGDVCVAGFFNNEITFQSGDKTVKLDGTEESNFFTASFSADGEFQKATRIGDSHFIPSKSEYWAVVYDEQWNMYLVPKDSKIATQFTVFADRPGLKSSNRVANNRPESPARFLSANPTSNGDVEIALDGRNEGVFVIESSTELERWKPVSTNVVTSGRIILQNAFDASVPKRFFRVSRHK